MQNIKMWQGSVIDKIMETKIISAIAEKQSLDFELFAARCPITNDVYVGRNQGDY